MCKIGPLGFKQCNCITCSIIRMLISMAWITPFHISLLHDDALCHNEWGIPHPLFLAFLFLFLNNQNLMDTERGSCPSQSKPCYITQTERITWLRFSLHADVTERMVKLTAISNISPISFSDFRFLNNKKKRNCSPWFISSHLSPDTRWESLIIYQLWCL